MCDSQKCLVFSLNKSQDQDLQQKPHELICLHKNVGTLWVTKYNK